MPTARTQRDKALVRPPAGVLDMATCGRLEFPGRQRVWCRHCHDAAPLVLDHAGRNARDSRRGVEVHVHDRARSSSVIVDEGGAGRIARCCTRARCARSFQAPGRPCVRRPGRRLRHDRSAASVPTAGTSSATRSQSSLLREPLHLDVEPHAPASWRSGASHVAARSGDQRSLTTCHSCSPPECIRCSGRILLRRLRRIVRTAHPIVVHGAAQDVAVIKYTSSTCGAGLPSPIVCP